MRSRALVACAALLLAPAAPAEDGNGDFAIKGAGILTCRVFLNEREQRSNVYYMIGGWLDGYMSALNKHAENTYDIASFESSELLVQVIFEHCRSHPEHRLYSVANSIFTKLSPTRLQTKSPMVAIRAGDREGALYETTVQKMQVALMAKGHFEGKADGQFGPDTREAMRRFQVSIGFDPTGYPDQATLWRLLRKEPPEPSQARR